MATKVLLDDGECDGETYWRNTTNVCHGKTLYIELVILKDV